MKCQSKECNKHGLKRENVKTRFIIMRNKINIEEFKSTRFYHFEEKICYYGHLGIVY